MNLFATRVGRLINQSKGKRIAPIYSFPKLLFWIYSILLLGNCSYFMLLHIFNSTCNLDAVFKCSMYLYYILDSLCKLYNFWQLWLQMFVKNMFLWYTVLGLHFKAITLELGTRQFFSFATTTTRQSNRVSLTPTNMK